MNDYGKIFTLSMMTIPVFILMAIFFNGLFIDIKKTKDEVTKKLQIIVLIFCEIVYFFLWACLTLGMYMILETNNIILLYTIALTEVFLFLATLFKLRRSR